MKENAIVCILWDPNSSTSVLQKRKLDSYVFASNLLNIKKMSSYSS